MIQGILSSTPWGILLAGDAQDLIDGIVVLGSGTPRLIIPVGNIPKYGGKRDLLPQVSFPFRWDGNTYCSFQLPTDPKPAISNHDIVTNVFLNNSEYRITQTNIVGRPSQKQQYNTGLNVESFIDWQIHCFRELSDENNLNDEFEEKAKALIRRNWLSVQKIWLGKKSDPALMALIVSISQDKELLRVFETIVNRPRHILLRYRQNTRLSRIQEIDSACIRDIAKRPGRTIFEKAGPRQELLAVQRRESRNTLENRIFVWVLNRIIEIAWRYGETNKHHTDSNRVKIVAKCNRRTSQWIKEDALNDVSTEHLQHPVQPNYTLQMNSRYKQVYNLYKKLLKEQQVIDDSWEWQRNLWAESAKQLMACALTSFFPEEYRSTPYYRNEGEFGVWAESPVAPGPFNTENGPCFVVDSKDVLMNLQPEDWLNNSPFKFAPYIGSLGCDQVLYWPENNTLLVVWFVYCSERAIDLKNKIHAPGQALRIFSLDLGRYARVSYRCCGIVLITEDHDYSKEKSLNIDIETWPSDGLEEVVGLKIPFTIAQTDSEKFEDIIEDLKVGIQLATDMSL